MKVKQPCVYRAFDADDRLLYIGYTTNFAGRVSNHRVASWWTELVTRWDVEVHLSVDDAKRAEMAAIVREAPPFNTALHPRRRGVDRIELSESDIAAARRYIARVGGGRLPYGLRWLDREAAPTTA